MSDQTRDEKVDGAKIAAEILNRMPSEQRTRIVRAIQETSPDAASKIEANLFTFNDLTEVTAQGIQTLLKEIEHRDLVLALKRASEAVRDHLFQNMSERKRNIVRSDYDDLPPTGVREIELAQQRILATVDKLKKEGKLRSTPRHSVWV